MRCALEQITKYTYFSTLIDTHDMQEINRPRVHKKTAPKQIKSWLVSWSVGVHEDSSFSSLSDIVHLNCVSGIQVAFFFFFYNRYKFKTYCMCGSLGKQVTCLCVGILHYSRRVMKKKKTKKWFWPLFFPLLPVL